MLNAFDCFHTLDLFPSNTFYLMAKCGCLGWFHFSKRSTSCLVSCESCLTITSLNPDDGAAVWVGGAHTLSAVSNSNTRQPFYLLTNQVAMWKNKQSLKKILKMPQKLIIRLVTYCSWYKLWLINHQSGDHHTKYHQGKKIQHMWKQLIMKCPISCEMHRISPNIWKQEPNVFQSCWNLWILELLMIILPWLYSYSKWNRFKAFFINKTAQIQ